MATVTKSFSDAGQSDDLFVKAGDKFTYTVDVSGDLDGSLYLRGSHDGGNSFFLRQEVSADATDVVVENDSGKNANYDFLLEYAVGEVSLTGTADVTLTDVDTVLHEFKDRNGRVVVQVTEAGLIVNGELSSSGVSETSQATDVASATTVDLEAATGNIVDVTGTTNITGITLSQGHWRLVRFTGILTLTHGASLVLPGATNISTAAGDYALFVGYASGVVRLAHYQRLAGGISVTLTGTETLTNKTLTSPALNTPTVTTATINGGTVATNALQTSVGVGAKNGATVTVVEYGSGGGVFKTVLTLTATPLSVVSVTTGAGVGGVKIYDFPEGYIRVLGCTTNFTSIGVETQGDFTDGTPEGDIGVGTVAPANADAFGTDATDDDLATGVAFTMTDYVATAVNAPEAAQNLDGHTAAKDVYVNALVDAADIDDDATTNLLITGTVTLTWVNLGDN